MSKARRTVASDIQVIAACMDVMRRAQVRIERKLNRVLREQAQQGGDSIGFHIEPTEGDDGE